MVFNSDTPKMKTIWEALQTIPLHTFFIVGGVFCNFCGIIYIVGGMHAAFIEHNHMLDVLAAANLPDRLTTVERQVAEGARDRASIHDLYNAFAIQLGIMNQHLASQDQHAASLDESFKFLLERDLPGKTVLHR